MSAITGIDSKAPYEERCQGLLEHQIALWDVLGSCQREGSLDSAIEKDTITVNDFAAFFKKHPCIRQIVLNGSAAFQLFQRHVITQGVLPGHNQGKKSGTIIHKLPSTSPAYAAMRPDAKKRVWLDIIWAV